MRRLSQVSERFWSCFSSYYSKIIWPIGILCQFISAQTILEERHLLKLQPTTIFPIQPLPLQPLRPTVTCLWYILLTSKLRILKIWWKKTMIIRIRNPGCNPDCNPDYNFARFSQKKSTWNNVWNIFLTSKLKILKMWWKKTMTISIIHPDCNPDCDQAKLHRKNPFQIMFGTSFWPQSWEYWRYDQKRQ